LLLRKATFILAGDSAKISLAQIPLHSTSLQRLRGDLFWDAARECDHFGTLSVTGIDTGGTVSLRANADSRAEFRPFMECFRHAVGARIERRRQAGEPVPPELLTEPTAEID